jgi:hypothetical protein
MGRMTVQHAATSLISLAFGKAYELAAERSVRSGRLTDEALQAIEAEALKWMRAQDLSKSPLDGDPAQAWKMAEDMLAQAFATWRRGRRAMN